MRDGVAEGFELTVRCICAFFRVNQRELGLLPLGDVTERSHDLGSIFGIEGGLCQLERELAAVLAAPV